MSHAPRLAVSAMIAVVGLFVGRYAIAAYELEPRDPVAGVIKAFDSYRVVVLGEGDHGNEQGHRFRLSLIRDPRFAKTVNDIVVEFGSSQYQDVMDRYVAGDDVPYDLVRRVWEDTAIAWTTWDVPIYREFFAAVREVNRSLPKRRQLRVLLGDKPIDWSRINSWDDFRLHLRTDDFPAAQIEREVLSRHRRALVVYADGHIVRKHLYWPLADSAEAERRFALPVNSIVTLLERAGERVFTIATLTSADLATLEPSVAAWVPPKLVQLKGTRLGMSSASILGANVRYIMVDREKGIEERVVADPIRSPRIDEQYDAMLYLGPKSSITYSQIPLELCRDHIYMQKRLRRWAIASPWDKNPGASLIARCATLAD